MRKIQDTLGSSQGSRVLSTSTFQRLDEEHREGTHPESFYLYLVHCINLDVLRLKA